MSIDIFSLLQSFPHNPHYLNRYIKFIQLCLDSNSKKTKEGLEYTENHHILPKSMFPEYESFKEYPSNKAVLTYRQHVVAHIMLWKAYPKNPKMVYAMNRMFNSENKIPRAVEIRYMSKIRKIFSDSLSTNYERNDKISKSNKGKKKSENHRKNISIAFLLNNPMKGKHHSEFSKLKMSKSRKGVCKSEEHKTKIAKSLLGHKKSEHSKSKQSFSIKAKENVTCPYCSRNGHPAGMQRWHFNNCKYKII